ncbi:MAG: copper chaperone CopZ [Syntrophomonadaceae bacterium]
MSIASRTINVAGMSCMHCVKAVKDAVGALPGITKVEVDLEGNQVTVSYDTEKVSMQKIKDTIEDTGYQVIE